MLVKEVINLVQVIAVKLQRRVYRNMEPKTYCFRNQTVSLRCSFRLCVKIPKNPLIIEKKKQKNVLKCSFISRNQKK